MSKLRPQLIILTISIAAFISLTMINDSVIPGFQIHPVLLLGICLAVLAEFVLPARVLTTPYYIVLSLVVIFLAGLVPIPTLPISFPENLFGLALELGFSAWIIYLAHTISAYTRAHEGIDKIAKLLGVDDPSMDIQSALPRIKADITRSRHYQRPLSVIVMDIPFVNNTDETAKWDAFISSWLGEQINQARMAKVVQRELRAMDLVLIDRTEEKLILVCPEIRAEDISEITRHLETAVYRELGIRPRYASATFPDDAFSFDGLRQQALEKFENQYKETEDIQPVSARRQLNTK